MNKLLGLVVVFLITACSTEPLDKHQGLSVDTSQIDMSRYKRSGKLESQNEEIVRNAILELTELSKKALMNSEISLELGSLIDNEFYVDKVVSISDLLNYNTSLVYKYADVPHSAVGKYADFFYKETSTNKEEYPNLLFLVSRESNQGLLKNASDDFYQNAQITYYMPYDEDDNGNLFDTTLTPTLVPSVIDADAGLGESYINGQWGTVMSDDDYAANNFTLIINPTFDPCSGGAFAVSTIAAEVEGIPVDCDNISSGSIGGSGNSSPANVYTGNCNELDLGEGYIRQVFIGRAKNVNGKQFDKFLSLSGNGGGSEIRYCRADSQQAIDIDSLGNYTTTQWDTRVSQYWTRKQIRKENVRKVSSLWDENWECHGTHEQLFVIYEDDNVGDLFIDQQLEFELGDETYAATIDVTIQNRSKDDAIIMRKRERVEFFATNLLDQGCNCWDGDGSFSDRCWGVYDCGAEMSYTMYHRWVFVGDNSQY